MNKMILIKRIFNLLFISGFLSFIGLLIYNHEDFLSFIMMMILNTGFLFIYHLSDNVLKGEKD